MATMMTKKLLLQRAMTVAATTTSRHGMATSCRSSSLRAVARGVGLGRAMAGITTGTKSALDNPPATCATGTVSRRTMSSSSSGDGSDAGAAGGGSSGDRFSDDLERLISSAGRRSNRSRPAATAPAAEGSSNQDGNGGNALVVSSEDSDGGGEGGEGEEDPVLSARAMKFRAMISKLKPQKKTVVAKAFSPSREPLVDNLGRSYGLGRRKTSTARVWISLSEGEGGVFVVNSKPMIEYFPRDHLQNEILKPLEFTRKLGNFHVRCTTKGGGQAGQAGAIRLGLARALEAHDPWLRKFMKKEGLMERDSRRVERKKTGLKKARKASQWVKR